MSKVNDWSEGKWYFRLHVLTIGDFNQVGLFEILKIMKFQIRSRVVSMIESTEAVGQGFAIATALLAGTIRIQIYWWTAEYDLHREAILGKLQERSWARMPSSEIGTLAELAIVRNETARFAHRLSE